MTEAKAVTKKRSNEEPMVSTEQQPKKPSLNFKTIDPNIDYSTFLNQSIFSADHKVSLRARISDATPYKWGSINQLVDETLLRNVRNEILNEIHFTKKETDIYKVFQSGDLRNMNGLDNKDLSRLPNLLKLRNALYCPRFRDFISYVTQAGKISANKYDMSLNIYHKSCHLLTHDDVIGSRRVSFILYLPDPDKNWKEHYGGALRLFGAHFSNVPKTDYDKKFVPQFNDYAFFEVKPGYSFHDVEEVKLDKQRISIQGWFHIPQEGEEGYIAGEEEKYKQQSSLQSLESKEFQQYDYPKLIRDPVSKSVHEQLRVAYVKQQKDDEEEGKVKLEELLSEEEVDYLTKYLNPNLVTVKELQRLNKTFLSESMISVHQFLNGDFAAPLKKSIRTTELELETPKLSKDVKFPWKTAMPSVKRRFLYIDGKGMEDELSSLEYEHESKEEREARQKEEKERLKAVGFGKPNFEALFVKEDSAVTINGNGNIASKDTNEEKTKSAQSDDEDEDLGLGDEDEETITDDKQTVSKLAELAHFLQSPQFKKFLLIVSSFIPISEQILIRRFRPGSDFTLATNQDTNFTNPNVTPGPETSASSSAPQYERINAVLEGTLCLTPSKNWESGEQGGYELCMAMDENDDPAIYRHSNADDSVLLNSQAGWNTFNLILRDSSILKFIKYVSFGASGSRWDINCQWDVEGFKDDESESESEEEEEKEEG